MNFFRIYEFHKRQLINEFEDRSISLMKNLKEGKIFLNSIQKRTLELIEFRKRSNEKNLKSLSRFGKTENKHNKLLFEKVLEIQKFNKNEFLDGFADFKKIKANISKNEIKERNNEKIMQSSPNKQQKEQKNIFYEFKLPKLNKKESYNVFFSNN